jgi:Predicted membrane protein (DUF2306)/Tetratricopeptide repeat
MSTQVQAAFTITDRSQTQRSPRRLADMALKAAARFWFVVVVLGQLIFAFSVASFYGVTAAQGNWRQWNKTMTHGYDAAHPIGNLVVAIHLSAAVIIMLSGTLQLIPLIQRRAPKLHRWNGRLYMLTAFAVSLAGLYMMWFRGTVGGLLTHLGQSLDAFLIMGCAVMALRYALARNFKTHRRWALRLFLAVSASLFIRAGIFLITIISPFGFDAVTLSGPLLTFMSYAQYLVPLAILEVYLRVQDGAGARGRFAMAAGLFVSTLALGAGIGIVTMASFLPTIKRAYDRRPSIADTLASTIASSGIEQATQQYRRVKASAPTTYNFDEDELNVLGYDLIKKEQFKQAIRIFQLNAEAYPQSANTWDSLGEAYMDDGDKGQAIALYRKSLQLNPKNVNAVKMLQKLNAN